MCDGTGSKKYKETMQSKIDKEFANEFEVSSLFDKGFT
jgi:hypothetical protein